MTAELCGSTLADMIADYLEGVEIKYLLTTSAFTFDKHVHEFRSDVTNEIVGTGYTEGGFLLAIGEIVKEPALSRVKVTPSSTYTSTPQMTASDIAQVVIYINTGDPTADRILGVYSLTPANLVNQQLGIMWQSSMILHINY